MGFKFLKNFFDNSHLKYGLILLGLGLTSYPILELTEQNGDMILNLGSIAAIIFINLFAFVQFILFFIEYFGLDKKKVKGRR
jgi:hypothetical protein